MLTRLHIRGFKNLVDVEVRFAAFTCIAGANAVGKSNLFDAIRFLSLLADHRLDEAARSIRAEDKRDADVRSLFTRLGGDKVGTIEFDLDMIVPPDATDDLGQKGEASTTFLNYKLKLGYREKVEDRRALGELELLHEELRHLKMTAAKRHLLFPHDPEWQKSVLSGSKASPLISTEPDEAEAKSRIVLHQDGVAQTGLNKRGSSYKRVAKQLPRTLLSAGDAGSPTVLCARVEMRNWEMLQLEPSAMRRSDSLNQAPAMDSTGAHAAATLHHLARLPRAPNEKPDADAVYQKVSNRLAELLGEIKRVGVDEDQRRELLTLYIEDRNGVTIPARSLSDGTLSFVALVLKQMETSGSRLLCMEEPENGIHPRRIPAILELLQEIAVDVSSAVDSTNPLRQVIINTHSPTVVQQVPEDSLLIAERAIQPLESGQRTEALSFSVLPKTWRAKADRDTRTVSKGVLLYYLQPTLRRIGAAKHSSEQSPRRVVDADFVQSLLNL